MTKIGMILAVLVLTNACAAPNTVRVNYDSAEISAEAALQRELALKKILDYKQRLNTVSYPILKAATKFCDSKKSFSMGARGSSSSDYKNEWRSTANKIFGGDEYVVTWVAEQGPAAKSGLAVNDRILAINDVKFGTSNQQHKKFYAEASRINKNTAPIKSLLVKRGDQLLEMDIRLETICGYPVVLRESDAVNAYADGMRIIITKGMMRFAQQDQELALVVAHELGHNLMGHLDKKKTNHMLGTIIDLAAAANGVSTRGTFANMGAKAFSQDFEAEADYVALYYMNAAGLPLEGSANFWRQMAAEHPGSIGTSHSASHPATSERFLAISNTIKEINHKIANGLPVEPNLSPSK
ncbi:MAG: M48 family metalloprotease [Porticoccaceae bacterium]